ncbi:hypothetical protein GR328_04365 [Microvirga makkahensis]|uniref:Prepilin type IV endopeptidase peptidase domain-containing protein n=2 Tax=Microvirga makkahensis TaxID=1128670 RepID=A0A7X3MP88_9HYPH|nr:hypothetical protein [Microvirga makkahensis]
MTLSTLSALVAGLVFVAGMVGAGLMDLLTMKIRNWLVLTLLAFYVVLAPAAGLDPETVGWSVATALVVLICGFLLFSLNWIGGGDAKLAAVTALWLGAERTPDYIMYTALFGGVLSVILLSLRKLELPLSGRASPWMSRLSMNETGLPYGVAMAPAALLVLPHTIWFASLSV